MRRGDLSEMSIGFRATGQSWNEDRTERTISEISLHRGDVSVVASAASPTSTASLRSAVTLEQRKALAARIGDRVTGPWGYTYDEPTGGSLTVARGGVPVVSRLSIIRARRAKLRRSPPGPATSPFGEFWNIGSADGVKRAVREVELGKARGPKEAAIKAWIRTHPGRIM